MPFAIGAHYTRDEIHSELGGEKVSFLPQKGGRIVCGCFGYRCSFIRKQDCKSLCERLAF